MSLESHIKDILTTEFFNSMKMQRDQLLKHREYVKRTGQTHSPDAVDAEWVEKYAPAYRIMHNTLVYDLMEYVILKEKNMLSKEIITEVVNESEERVFSYKWDVSQQRGYDVGLAFAFEDWYKNNKASKEGFIKSKLSEIKKRLSLDIPDRP